MKVAKSVPSVMTVALLALTMVLYALAASTAVAAPARQEGAGAVPFSDPQDAVDAAAEWLVATHQNDDGGFSSFSAGANVAPSDVGGTVDAMLALGAAGSDLSALADYLETNLDALVEYAAQDGSTAGKAVLALTVAGLDPRAFGDHDFVVDLANHLLPSGQYGVENAFGQSLAMLGSATAGESVPEAAVEWLGGTQEREGELAGSWDDGFGTAGNADATAMAILALSAAGKQPDDASLAQALDFLAEAQVPTAGWEYAAGFGENANSTALVVQALYATGEDVSSPDSQWLVGGQTPLTALLSWQNANGAFQADFGEGRFDDFFSTVQALPALTTALDSEDDASSAIAGGDSPLPFWIIGAAALLVGGTIIWLFATQRK